MGSHPRLKYYPFHKDYENHANEFRPFVTSFGQPNYRSASLNTDQLGFRNQFDINGNVLDFYQIKDTIGSCNLLLGGSTAFGTDSSSDHKTFANLVTAAGVQLLNWGFRGALCQQELITYLTLKPLLPPVENIILFSGANDASLACLSGEFSYPEWGSVFSEDFCYNRFNNQYLLQQRDSVETRKVFAYVEETLSTPGWKKSLLTWLSRSQPVNHTSVNQTFNDKEKFTVVLGHLKNCLDSWNCMAPSKKIKVHYVLQPVAGWTKKRLSDRESECLAADMQTVPGLKKFTSGEYYADFKAALATAMEGTDILFYDANLWFNEDKYLNEDIFTDSCHLNDRGNELISQLLLDRISWN